MKKIKENDDREKATEFEKGLFFVRVIRGEISHFWRLVGIEIKL